jgi:predicted transcriptional regulator
MRKDLTGGISEEGICSRIGISPSSVKRYLAAREKEAFIERILKEICGKERVGMGELRLGSQRRAVSRVRGKVSWILNREYGISLAEIARRLGAAPQPLPRPFKKWRGKCHRCKFSTTLYIKTRRGHTPKGDIEKNYLVCYPAFIKKPPVKR